MVYSGLRIYWSNDIFTVTVFGREFFKFFPTPVYDKLDLGHKLAEGLGWHFTFGWFFALNGIAYALYMIFSGEWREILPQRKSFKEAVLVALHDLHLVKELPPQGKFNAAQRVTYSGILFAGFGMVLTGLAIYKPNQLSPLAALFGGYEVARWLHFWMTMGFIGFFVVHVGQVIKTGLSNFLGMVTGYELVTVEVSPTQGEEVVKS